MAYSEAQKRATMKYKKKTYVRINIDVRKEVKERLRNYASKKGVSLSSFVIKACEEKAEREGLS